MLAETGADRASAEAPERDRPLLRVKICGLTTESAVDAAVAAEATHVGFVLTDSPRRVSAERAARLAERVPANVRTVAVFRHATARELETALDVFQPSLIQVETTTDVLDFIGTERLLPVLHDGADLVAEAMSVARALRRPGPAVLEAAGRGGRGVRPDWSRARTLASTMRLFLAGGLTPANVDVAVRTVRPWGVDVSSGVERSRGEKDTRLIEEFVTAARGARS